MDQGKAWRLAAGFMAKQSFATNYATQGGVVGPVAGLPGCFDVEFARLGTNATARGIVRADIVKRECHWMGEWGPEFLKQEIDRIAALCRPARGSTRQQVEARFGAGKPTINAKGSSQEPLPEDSPDRAYQFGTNDTLLVHYDQDWKVGWAEYLDPNSDKGRNAGVSIPLDEEMRELTRRLRQMERILAEYQARWGHRFHSRRRYSHRSFGSTAIQPRFSPTRRSEQSGAQGATSAIACSVPGPPQKPKPCEKPFPARKPP